ncbi:MAG: hypothetical protein HPY57_15045 [Ignavibacteria bacterium]|nr:hypothetical protein [Ignavibacteria bacterium]
MLYFVFFITIGGFILKGDYEKFHNFLMEKSQKELIYVKSYDTIKDINVNVKNYSERVFGRYVYITNATPIENFVKQLPRIEWCKEHMFGKTKTLFSLMTFAHELGHHYALKENDHSEKRADYYAVKLFKEHFPIWKQVLYFPVYWFYTGGRNFRIKN